MVAGPYVPRTVTSAPSRRHTRKHPRGKHGLRAGLPQTLHTMGLAESPLPQTLKPPKLRLLHLTKNCGCRPDQAARCSRAARPLPSK